MKTEEEFKNYYATAIKDQLIKLDLLQSVALKQKLLTISGIIIVLIFCIIINPYLTPGAGPVLFIVILCCSGYLYKYVTSNSLQKYMDFYRNNFVRGFVHFFNSDFEYNPNHGIPQAGFELSDIFGDISKDFYSSDLIEGDIGNTHIKFSYLEATTESNFFMGLFCIADFNKEFNTKLYVLRKDIHTKGTDLISKLHIGRPPLITLDNPDFNHFYAVYGEDPVESRYIMTPAFMERIIDFGKKHDNFISMSFLREHIFIALDTSERIFQKKPSDSDAFETMHVWYSYINSVFDLVNELNLNTSIWISK